MRIREHDITHCALWHEEYGNRSVVLTGNRSEDKTGDNSFVRELFETLNQDGNTQCHNLCKSGTAFLESDCMEEILKIQPGVCLIQVDLQNRKTYEYLLANLPYAIRKISKSSLAPIILFTVPSAEKSEPSRLTMLNQLQHCIAEVNFCIGNQILFIDGNRPCPHRAANREEKLQPALIERLADEVRAFLM